MLEPISTKKSKPLCKGRS